MRFIRVVVLVVLVLNILLLAGLVGFCVATGRLDKRKALTMLMLLKHKGTPPHLEKKVRAILHPKPVVATTQPVKPAAVRLVAVHKRTPWQLEMAMAASSRHRLRLARQATALEHLRLAHAAQELRLQQKLLNRQRQNTQYRWQQIVKKQNEIKAAIAGTKTKMTGGNFTKTLAIYRKMPPRNLKKIFMGLPPADVARYLSAMSSQHAAKIVAQFTSRRGTVFISGVLGLLKASGTKSAIPSPNASNAANRPG